MDIPTLDALQVTGDLGRRKMLMPLAANSLTINNRTDHLDISRPLFQRILVSCTMQVYLYSQYWPATALHTEKDGFEDLQTWIFHFNECRISKLK